MSARSTPSIRTSGSCLLSHSRGGLLTRSFLKRFPREARFGPHRDHPALAAHREQPRDPGDDRARRDRRPASTSSAIVITQALGWLLDMADSDAYKEMAIGSPFLTDLADRRGAAPGRRVLHIRRRQRAPDAHPPVGLHARQRAPEMALAAVRPCARSRPRCLWRLPGGGLASGRDRGADRGPRRSPHRRQPHAPAVRAPHQTNPINHAEALWDPILQAQVLRILGVDIPGGERPDVPSFWG